MNNLSRVIVIVSSLAALVAIVWMVTRDRSPGGVTPAGGGDPAAVQLPEDLQQRRGEIVLTQDSPANKGRYPAINDPDKVRNVRRPGWVYTTEVAGQVAGEGSAKDWGLRGAAKFRLAWTLVSDGDVVSNDGSTIVEDRSFRYHEEMTVDSVRAGLEMNDVTVWGVAGIVGGLSTLLSSGSDGGLSVTGVAAAIQSVNGTMYTVPPEALRLMAEAGKWAGIPEMDLAQGIRVKLPRPEFAMLDGKTVRITIENGKGVTKLEPRGCTLSPHEQEVITRVNNLSDHYVFPDRTVAVGSGWSVPSDNLGSIVDPRLRGLIVSSDVRMKRTDDSADAAGGRVLNVALERPTRLQVSKSGDGREVTGEVQLDDARFELPDAEGVVTKIEASGNVEYRERSTDHLLFEAEVLGRPSVRVWAKTTVRKR